MNILKFPSLLIAIFILASCGGKKFSKSPVDDMIRDMTNTPTFTILLYDMDVQGTFFKTYHHQYRLITEKGDSPTEKVTPWLEVSEKFFYRHENDMGMELASKSEGGKVNKTVGPPGYSNYVGNEKYGRWENRGGSSFWAFYGQYMFMSSMFNMMAYPVRRSYYNNYRTNHYGTGRSYYGPRTTGGAYAYGTNSQFNRTTKPNSRYNNSFRSRVRSSTSRSSRSGSRYSSGSSTRSRGGGFGK